MKKLIFFVVALVTMTMFWSCEDDDLPPGITGPSISIDTTLIKIEGKTFENSWELYDTIHDLQGHVIKTPWSKNGKVGPVSDEDALDIKREDGWRMITRILEGNDATLTNYVILYNEITGVLKIFNYCWTENARHNSALWKLRLSSQSGNAVNKMLYSAMDLSLPLSVDESMVMDSESEYICTASDESPICAIGNGWNVVKMPLSYDPSANPSLKLNVKTKANTTTYIHLFGDFQSNTTGKAITTYNTSLASDTKASLVKTGEKATKEWLDKKLANSSISNKLKDAITGGTASLVKAGINLLGSSFFGMFSKRQNSSYVIELTTNTHGDLNGSSEQPEGTGIPICDIPINESKTKTKLGSWNLSDFPTLYVHPVARNISKDITTDENIYKLVATGNSKVDVVFNPELKKHIISSKVECVPVYYHRAYHVLPETLVIPPYDGTLSVWYGDYSTSLTYVEGEVLYDFGGAATMQLNNLGATSTFYNLWSRYGKNKRDGGMWNYIYVPKELQYSHQHVKYSMMEIYAKVTVTLVTEFEGKRETTVMTRTYSPKIDWDPEQVERYKNMSMQDLQSYASYDHIVNEKD